MNLVVYYSRSGNIKQVAESYVNMHGGDLCEIISETDFSGSLGFAKGCAYAAVKKATPIAPIDVDFSRYDRVVVCGAVWAGSIACPVRTFLQQYGSRCAEVEYIIARRSPSSSYDAVFDELDALCGKKRVQATSLVHGQVMQWPQ